MSAQHTNAYDAGFQAILDKAYSEEASDIHIEPLRDELVVRIRVDGVLHKIQSITDERFRARFLEIAKRTCRFDMGVIGAPQDKRFSTEFPPLDYRAALIPLLEGESIVLRLLERNRDFSLESYRMREDAKVDLASALTKRDGLIIVSGPTGSGKSTLLYSAMSALDRASLKVCTLEDPVEYRLSGVTQSEVDASKGRTFGTLLRALMRGDPDVILVGEIRDEETAEAAIHAAKTGHLVLSTVHASSVDEIEARLGGLGVSRELYQASLRFASAQRLVPKQCPHCRVPDPERLALVQAVFGEVDFVPQKATGCDNCQGRGIAGRVLLFEWQHKTRDGLSSRGGLQAEALASLRKGDIHATVAAGY